MVAPSAGAISPFAKNLLTSDAVYLAHVTGEGADLEVRLTNAAASTNQEVTIGVGLRSGMSAWPSVAASELGGAVAWYYAPISPTAFKVLVQPFGRSGQTLTPQSSVTLPPVQSGEAARAPSGPSITYVGNAAYFVSWSEGASAGAARVMGRFIQFE